MKKQIFIAFITCISLFGCKSDYNNKLRAEVTLDSRVELISIMCYLSDYEEYNKCQIASYKTEIDSYFKDFRNHKAILFLKDIREKYQTGHDAPLNFAVYLTDSLTPAISFEKLPKDFNPNWDESVYNQLAEHAQQFALDTKFNIFFQKQNNRYKQEIEYIEKEINSSIKFDWFTSFFGEIPENSNFKVIISLTVGNCNYGPSSIINNEKTFYSIIGAFDHSDSISIGSSDDIIIHEFCHSFCNPIIDKYKERLDSIGKLILNDYMNREHDNAYNNWTTVLNETLVRVSVACYLSENENWVKSKLNFMTDKKKGFMWTKTLTDSFLKLQKKTSVLQSEDLYINEFIKVLNEYLTKGK